ncbi:GNAT family N-acetyltransferase [Priestia taiwanensis]|uniref:N-acetyltransferase n=1 Tax=Priestia taiwanensis TaxID=1347902 RepID=A0A917EM92_9BACI|nr:GNAT family N-acetyltransferase [Priestia taiwanensis]MBM7362460.1 ribosomal protein S18 acetylase RimI-like enzyme [Priestia taiwanensis]GGE62372.1 N-acetyltransferase [Priestia taiwanensis]
MICLLDVDNQETAKELYTMQLESYKVEANLIDFHDLPPLKETLEVLQASQETFYGYYMENKLVGAISYKVVDNVLDIHRVIVKPTHFRRGIAQELMKKVLYLPKQLDKVIVSTAKKNTPAIHLYKRFGFRLVEEIYLTDKLTLVKMEKSFV